ncbi:hypothetical protein GCM10010515_13710 [Streptomyces fructofermentans]|uniref:Uncharacterized protein n=1 Tax=Streptomyces fructofermentans TaxID=152141 RepID=A0A918N8C9_9ACTN|nr:hypothetical protein GCM10010515_13710 [Streptomyces fructofermentans]
MERVPEVPARSSEAEASGAAGAVSSLVMMTRVRRVRFMAKWPGGRESDLSVSSGSAPDGNQSVTPNPLSRYAR